MGAASMADSVDMWICPDCGAEVRVGARGCPRCARRSRRKPAAVKTARRSWEQDAAHDGLDLPDDNGFDYDDFVAREFGGKAHRRIGVRWWWWVTALGLVGWLGWLAWHGGW